MNDTSTVDLKRDYSQLFTLYNYNRIYTSVKFKLDNLEYVLLLLFSLGIIIIKYKFNIRMGVIRSFSKLRQTLFLKSPTQKKT